jgi:hypothetical protein
MGTQAVYWLIMMADYRIHRLAGESPSLLSRLIEAAGAHGDLGLASRQAGVEPADAEAILLYEGDDPCVTEASIALYAAVREGRARQNGYARRVFLAHLSMHGILHEAVAAQPWHPLRWFLLEREKDPDFDEAWAQAQLEAAGKLRAEAWRRGVDGVEDPLSFRGQLTGDAVKKYSDTLLLALLKAHDPAFRESSKVELSAAPGGAVDAGALLAGLSGEELAVLERLAGRHGGADGDEGVLE